MAENVQRDTIDKVRAQLLGQAYRKAAAVLYAQTALSPSTASAVAPAVVDAVAPALRAEHAQQLSGITGEQATKLGAASIGVLALDLTMFGVIAARGPRWSRPLACLAIVTHASLFAYSKRSSARVRAAARVETARDYARSMS
jgi:hypothetical protein